MAIACSDILRLFEDSVEATTGRIEADRAMRKRGYTDHRVATAISSAVPKTLQRSSHNCGSTALLGAAGVVSGEAKYVQKPFLGKAIVNRASQTIATGGHKARLFAKLEERVLKSDIDRARALAGSLATTWSFAWNAGSQRGACIAMLASAQSR